MQQNLQAVTKKIISELDQGLIHEAYQHLLELKYSFDNQQSPSSILDESILADFYAKLSVHYQMPKTEHLSEETILEIANKLKYIIQLSEQSACQVIDITSKCRDQLESLKKSMITHVPDNAMQAEISKEIDQCAEELNQIVLSQSYQDLSGQLLKKLVKQVEVCDHMLLDIFKVVNVRYGKLTPNTENSLSHGYGAQHQTSGDAVGEQDLADQLFGNSNNTPTQKPSQDDIDSLFG